MVEMDNVKDGFHEAQDLMAPNIMNILARLRPASEPKEAEMISPEIALETINLIDSYTKPESSSWRERTAQDPMTTDLLRLISPSSEAAMEISRKDMTVPRSTLVTRWRKTLLSTPDLSTNVCRHRSVAPTSENFWASYIFGTG